MRSYTFFLSAIAMLCANSVFAAEMSPVGTWRTIDDETGKPKSIVEITDTNGVLSGKVVQILQSDKGPDPVCDECDGERKNKPIKGMVIMWDMKHDGDVWDGGQIIKPSTGTIYRCKLSMLDNGTKLQVRGFVGFAFIGKTQIWERVTP